MPKVEETAVVMAEDVEKGVAFPKPPDAVVPELLPNEGVVLKLEGDLVPAVLLEKVEVLEADAKLGDVLEPNPPVLAPKVAGLKLLGLPKRLLAGDWPSTEEEEVAAEEGAREVEALSSEANGDASADESVMMGALEVALLVAVSVESEVELGLAEEPKVEDLAPNPLPALGVKLPKPPLTGDFRTDEEESVASVALEEAALFGEVGPKEKGEVFLAFCAGILAVAAFAAATTLAGAMPASGLPIVDASKLP